MHKKISQQELDRRLIAIKQYLEFPESRPEVRYQTLKDILLRGRM